MVPRPFQRQPWALEFCASALRKLGEKTDRGTCASSTVCRRQLLQYPLSPGPSASHRPPCPGRKVEGAWGLHVFFRVLAVAKTVSLCVRFETSSSMFVSKINATQLINISHVVGAAHPSYNYMVRPVVVYIRPCAFAFWPGSEIDFGTPACSIKVFLPDYKVSIVYIPPNYLRLNWGCSLAGWVV